jgi:hypothetical protein
VRDGRLLISKIRPAVEEGLGWGMGKEVQGEVASGIDSHLRDFLRPRTTTTRKKEIFVGIDGDEETVNVILSTYYIHPPIADMVDPFQPSAVKTRGWEG